MNEKIYYTVSDLENMLKVSRPTIYNLLKEEYFHWVKIGNKVFISKDSFDRWFFGMDEEGC